MFTDKKYSLRYWMTVIMARWTNLTEIAIQDKFGIPRNTLKIHLLKNPRTYHYVAPTKKKYVATTADEIVHYLSKPDEEVVVSDETYSLRFWLSIVMRRFLQIDRRRKQLAKLLGISESKIKRGAANGLTPASQNFLAAIDRRKN